MAAKYKLAIEQGTTVSIPLRLKNNGSVMSLAGYTARMQIRTSASSDEIIHELTTENGGISIDAASGLIGLYISAEDTAAFCFKTAVYDLELINSSHEVVRLLEGQVTLSLEVTR